MQYWAVALFNYKHSSAVSLSVPTLPTLDRVQELKPAQEPSRHKCVAWQFLSWNCERLLITLATLDLFSEVVGCGTRWCQKYVERHDTFVFVRHPSLAQLCCIRALWPQPKPQTSSSGSFNFKHSSSFSISILGTTHSRATLNARWWSKIISEPEPGTRNRNQFHSSSKKLEPERVPNQILEKSKFQFYFLRFLHKAESQH